MQVAPAFSDAGAELRGYKALLRLTDQAKTVAPSDSTVLILGESGTGKELIARALPCAHAVKSRTGAGAFIRRETCAVAAFLVAGETTRRYSRA